MNGNAQRAFEKLNDLGASAYQCKTDDGYGPNTCFVFGRKSPDGTQCFADRDGEHIRESWVNAEWINPTGLRHDVFEILAEHQLGYDWEDAGTLLIYDESEEPKGAFLSRVNELKRERENTKVADQRVPLMDNRAFKAMKTMARIGLPVWDLYSYSSTYPPTAFGNDVQFVMNCHWDTQIQFASHPIDEIDDFPETERLCRECFDIAKQNGLSHRFHQHRYDDRWNRTLELVAFHVEGVERGHQ